MPAPKFSTIPLLVAASPKADLQVAEDMHVLAPLLKLAFGAMGSKVIVTHGKDGAHSPRSRHDDGYCLDIRIWGLQFGSELVGSKLWWKAAALWFSRLAEELAAAVGPHVYLVLEKHHLHLEWAGPGQVANIKGWARGRYFYMTDEVRNLMAG